MTASRTWQLGYRPALDGVRGCAALMVVLAHLVDGRVASGLVGVTLFFVLSGYLITSLLRREVEQHGTVGLRAFWERRARRLLPAIAVYVVIAFALGSAFRPTEDNARHAAGSLLYVANWMQAAGEPMGLFGHIWSLSIEEQFYILWPLVALILIQTRRAAGWLLVVAGAVVGARFLVSPDVAYFATPFRADALIVGSALAMWGGRLPLWSLGVGVGLAVMGSIYVVATPALPLLLAVIGGALIVGVTAERPVGALSIAPLRWTGRISYGLYLWHVPFTLLLAPWLRDLGVSELVVWPVVIGGSYVVAAASWRWIESPFLVASVGPDRGIVGLSHDVLPVGAGAEVPPRSS